MNKYVATIGEVDNPKSHSEISVEAENGKEAWKIAFDNCDKPFHIPIKIADDNGVAYDFFKGFAQ